MLIRGGIAFFSGTGCGFSLLWNRAAGGADGGQVERRPTWRPRSSASAAGRAPSTPSPEQTTIQALDRALRILKVLADGEGMSLTELAEAAGQAPATVYRVLSTFEAHGIVEVQPATQLWFVGQEAFRIGSAFLGRTSLVEQARGGDARADGRDRRDREPRHRRRRAGGVHQPGRDARADPRLLPARHARADPRQRASARRCSPTIRPRRSSGSCASRGSPPFTAAHDHRPRRGCGRSSPRSGRGAGRWTTRSAPRACAASPRRSSTSSARRSPASRSRARPSAWPRAGDAELGARVRAAADRITRAIGGAMPEDDDQPGGSRST